MRFVHPCVVAVVLGTPMLACGKNLILGDDPVSEDDASDPSLVQQAKLEAGAPTPSGADAAAPAAESGAPRTPRVAFVTYRVYTADSVKGLNGADYECNLAASETPALQGKRFVAFLSDDTQSAKARLGTSTGPFERVDGKRVADDVDQLLGGNLTNAINLDEDGDPVSGYAWTGTNRGMPTYGFTCVGWTSTSGGGIAGALVADSGKWMAAKTEDCGGGKKIEDRARHHLYCFERDP